jgi:hypothetical protein
MQEQVEQAVTLVVLESPVEERVPQSLLLEE